MRRRDRVPPCAFPGREIEPDETLAEAAVREVAEETGLQVCPDGELGRRTHPATGRTIITSPAPPPATPTRQWRPREKVTEICWVSLDELDQLMPDLYRPAREHLAALLGGTRHAD